MVLLCLRITHAVLNCASLRVSFLSELTQCSSHALLRCLQATADFSTADGSIKLRSSATQVLFPGFMRAFQDFETDPEEEEQEEDEGREEATGKQDQGEQARMLISMKV